jgi:hypothetical protein
MKTQIAISILTTLLTASAAHADAIIIRNGDVLNGTILQTNKDGILFRCDYGTVTYPIGTIKQIHLDSAAVSNRAAISVSTNVLPAWGTIVTSLSKEPWAHELRQIPATVIDKGVLRNVPYISFRCGVDYEVNVYGDLDRPAGVEIGVYRSLLSNDAAKQHCVDFISALVPQYSASLRLLSRDGAIVAKGDIKLEITPPTAEDAYKGWWVSVYSEPQLNLARASETELRQISQQKSASASQDTSWSVSDLERARPSSSYGSGAYASQSSGDRVYVRGYVRKDGTYVSSYTRSYPRHR